MMIMDLPPGVQALLDVAAIAIQQAHELARSNESGRAITDYLSLEHNLQVYRHDLENTP